MFKHAIILFLATLSFLFLGILPAQALYQTDVQFLGLSEDLDKLGVTQTWTDPADGLPHCKVELYKQGQWEPVETHDLTGEKSTGDSLPFKNKCKLYQSDWVDQ